MKYKVIVHNKAAHYLDKLAAFQREKIKQSLKELENGIAEKTNVKPMAGDWKGYYRMRHGNIRIIFWIDHPLRTIYVDHIGSRGDVYKKH